MPEPRKPPTPAKDFWDQYCAARPHLAVEPIGTYEAFLAGAKFAIGAMILASHMADQAMAETITAPIADELNAEPIVRRIEKVVGIMVELNRKRDTHAKN